MARARTAHEVAVGCDTPSCGVVSTDVATDASIVTVVSVVSGPDVTAGASTAVDIGTAIGREAAGCTGVVTGSASATGVASGGRRLRSI